MPLYGGGEKLEAPDAAAGRARFVLTLMVLGMVFMVSALKTSMSVAIVAMVKARSTNETSTGNSSGGARDMCPRGAIISSAASQAQGDLSWTELEQSYALGAHSYGSVVSALALSRAAELLGAGRVLVTLVACSAALNLLGPVAARSDVRWLVALRALQGVAWGPLYSCVALLSARWFPADERHRMSGLIYSAGNIGTVASMGVSGIVAARLGWPAIFYGYGLVLLCWCALCLATVADDPQSHWWISGEEKRYLLDRCPTVSQDKPAVPWRRVLTSGPVWAYLLHDSGFNWLTVMFMSELPTYIRSILHSDLESAGYLSMLPFICTWISNVFSGSCAHWLRQKGILSHLTCYRVFNGLAMLGPALVLLGVSWAGCDTAVVVGLFAVAMTLHGAYYGGSIFNMLDLSVSYAGTLSGLVNTSVGVVSIAAPTLVGLVTNGQETISAWRTVFYASAAMTVVPYVLFFFLGSVEEQPWGRTD